ncbi:PQQ-binding-like beta-propeller repeat protein [Candidatus Aenigmatarchaeota archaeon]
MDGYRDSRQKEEQPSPEEETKYYAIERVKEEIPKHDFSTFDNSYDMPQGGNIWATPIYHNGVIYFGACNKNFYALSAETGKELWKFIAGDVIFSSAVIHDGVVYFGSYDGFLYALTLEGKLLWKFKTGHRIVSSPCVVEDRVYFGSGDKKFYCLSTGGEKKWEFITGDAIVNSPAVVNNDIYFGSFDKKFYCLSPDGAKKWEVIAGNFVGGFGSPVIADERGNEIWNFRDRSHKKSPKTENGFVYFGSRDNNFYCTDLNGEIKWKFITDGMTGSHGLLDNKNIYFSSFDRHVYSVTYDGKLNWKFEADGPITNTPIFHDNKIYVASIDGSMYCIGENGKLVWKFDTGDIIISSPLIVNGVLYFGGGDANLYAIDTKERKVLWSFQTGFKPANIKHVVKAFLEFDKQLFKLWKPETTKIKTSETDQGYKGKVDVPEGLTYGGEQTYSSSNPAYTGGGSYHSKRDKKKNKFGPKWMDM